MQLQKLMKTLPRVLLQIDLSEISSGLSLEKDAEIKAEMTILDPSLAKIVILNE